VAKSRPPETAPASAEVADSATPDFEQALAELEALVERMESGDMSLDASLAAFERGINLTRQCQKALADAEQRVRVLLERDDGRFDSAPLDADPGASES
jgi:exodeoxyribonuclease VII small subunit